MKTCKECKIEKAESEFAASEHTVSKLQPHCRACGVVKRKNFNNAGSTKLDRLKQRGLA